MMPNAEDERPQRQIPEWGDGAAPGKPANQPTPASDRPPPVDKDAPQPGLLAEMLYLDERYPVLLAGSAESGKSTIIISLIHAAARSGRDGGTTVDVAIGNSFFKRAKDLGDPIKVQAIRDFADRFFQNSRADFMLARKELGGTQTDVPVVIPLDLTFRDDGTVVKLAIIDGRGEWYEPITTEGAKMYRELHPDIENLVAMYEPAISFIWVAPVMDDDKRQSAQHSDKGLEAAMSKYQDHRPPVSWKHDSHLYLLSKWDSRSSYDTGEYFERVDGSSVVDYVDEFYRLSWDKYRGLPLGQHDGDRRKFMQYCSWRFQNGKPVQLTPKQQDAFLRYPRTLLNWLVSNAVRVEGRRDGRLESVLKFTPFPDVMPHDTVYVPLSTKIIRMLT